MPYSGIEDRVIEELRWSLVHNLVFEDNGHYYQTYYSVGATEMQPEQPWEYEDEVKCTEVCLTGKIVKVWSPVP